MKLEFKGLSLIKSGSFVCGLAFSVPVFAGGFGSGDKRVTVQGQCALEASPDRGAIVFVAEQLQPNAKSAIQKATELYERLRTELKKSKAKDLELSSSEYSVQERKEWENQKNVSKGFVARLGLRVTTSEIAALGELIATAAQVGIRETGGLTTYLSEPRLLEEKKKCLQLAAKNAREKAETLAKSLGSKVGAPLQIMERSTVPNSTPVLEGAMLKNSAQSLAPAIEGQRVSIMHEIEVTFALE